LETGGRVREHRDIAMEYSERHIAKRLRVLQRVMPTAVHDFAVSSFKSCGFLFCGRVVYFFFIKIRNKKP
jgi:hypothetical protein